MLQRNKMDLFYKPNSPMAKIVEDSTLAQQVYTPYIFAWCTLFQVLILAVYSHYHEQWFQAEWHREVFALSDGQKIGIDWFEEEVPEGEKMRNEKRPLLVCLSGLRGDAHHFAYMKEVCWRARQKGYQVVFVMYRGACMPIETDKIYH